MVVQQSPAACVTVKRETGVLFGVTRFDYQPPRTVVHSPSGSNPRSSVSRLSANECLPTNDPLRVGMAPPRRARGLETTAQQVASGDRPHN